MAALADTMRSVNAITGNGDTVVPAWVLVEKRRERAEHRRRVAATIAGQAEMSG
jgi:hypothetical protein